ncbi:MAG TPA: hypothetical protein VF532_15445 [Candidatus Angelobacter sp.]
MTHGFCHKAWMENDPDLATVRDHPRFQAVMENLEAEDLSVPG